MPTAACRSRRQAPATCTAPPRRRDASRGGFAAWRRRVIRRIGFAEDVDGVAGLQRPPGEGHISIERKINDRERPDRIEHPDSGAFHRPAALSEHGAALTMTA